MQAQRITVNTIRRSLTEGGAGRPADDRDQAAKWEPLPEGVAAVQAQVGHRWQG